MEIIGLGTSVLRPKMALGRRAMGINVAEAAADPDRFATVRGEANRPLRTLVATGQGMFPADDALMGERAAPKHTVVNPNGTVRVQEREATERRLGQRREFAGRLMPADLARPAGPSRSIACC